MSSRFRMRREDSARSPSQAESVPTCKQATRRLETSIRGLDSSNNAAHTRAGSTQTPFPQLVAPAGADHFTKGSPMIAKTFPDMTRSPGREASMSKWRQYRQGDTLNLMVDATNACQLDCRYCYFGRKASRVMDVGKVFASVKALVSWFCGELENVNLHYMGGEPLLAWKQILELNRLVSEHCCSKGLSSAWSMTSNLVALDEEKAAHMLAEGARIHCSVDGPARIHNRNRPYANTGRASFDDVRRSIPLALGVWPDDTARVTVCPEDAADLWEIASCVLDMGFQRVGLFPVTGREWAPAAIDAWAAGLEHALASALAKYEGKKTISTVVSPSDSKTDTEKVAFGYCGAGKALWALDTDGTLHFCHRLTSKPQYSIGRAYEHTPESLEAAIDGSTLLPSLDCLPAQCRDCEAIRYCNGGCWADNLIVNGDSNSPLQSACTLKRASVPVVEAHAKAAGPSKSALERPVDCNICVGHCFAILCVTDIGCRQRCDTCDKCYNCDCVACERCLLD